MAIVQGMLKEEDALTGEELCVMLYPLFDSSSIVQDWMNRHLRGLGQNKNIN